MLGTIILCSFVVVASAYNILVVFPYPGKSHMILGEGYVRILLEAKHNVTYITPGPIHINHEKLRQIDVSSNKFVLDFDALLDFSKIMTKEIDIHDTGYQLGLMQNLTGTSILHPNVQKLLLNTEEVFDAVIVEWLYSDLYSGFATVFDCPLIWSAPHEPHPMILRLVESLPNPAYFPDHRSQLVPPLTFQERVKELWHVAKALYFKWSLEAEEIEIYKKSFGPAVEKRGRVLPKYDEVKYNGSLVLGNSYVTSGLPFSLPQNYKMISGYYIPKKTAPLPDNLKTIMDKATNGVIYFSMGTMVKSRTFPEDIKRKLLNIFKDLKQTVIWKFEESIKELPSNVHIVKWAPQKSILAHPNCVLFITHGGLLSTTETLHFGIPIIGIPVFSDQFMNIKRAETKGFALKVDLDFNTPTNLKAAIDEILRNPKYREKAKELSFIYHDRPVSPGAELVHWVEHVVKTRGALHLRSPALHVPLYQKLYLDLLAVILAILMVVVKVFNYILKIWSVKKETHSKKKN